MFTIFTPAYSNSLEALNPEWWAMEGLVVLEEMLVVANLVNRDYDNVFTNKGEVVHVHKPGSFIANEMEYGSPVTVQDATASGVDVRLDQHSETTFHIYDRDVQKSIPELRKLFLVPAIRSIVEKMDGAIVGAASEFYEHASGSVGTALTKDSIIDLDRIQNDLLVPTENRALVVGPRGKADILKLAEFSTAEKTGQASALLTGRLGEVMGYQTYMSQTVGKTLAAGVATTTEDVTAVGIIGSTTLSISSADAAHTKGTWFKISGTPGIYRLTAAISTTNTSMSFYPALSGGVLSDAVVTFYESTGVIDGAVTANNRVNKINTDGYASANAIPRVGQYITIGDTDTNMYAVTRVEGTYVNNTSNILLTLNRPLEASVADGIQINVVPSGGQYNLAFTPGAITLVNRPLAAATTGVDATTVNNGEYALRVTMSYNPDYMRHQVTVDTLFGVKVLDTDQGALLLN